MAKDDYDVIVFRVLVYFYGVLKHKIMFEKATFDAAVRKHTNSEEYFAKILKMMQEEGLIQGLVFTKAWGGDVILLSAVEDAEITAKGIHYVEENDKMKRICAALKDTADLIAKLAQIVGIRL